MSEEGEQLDQLVVVVHGVGDPMPGETLSKLARSIAGKSQPLKETQQVLWLNEPCQKTSEVSTYPSHVRKLEFASAKVNLAEIFWGDISRVSHGILGAIHGLFEILFGLRFVSYVAADQDCVFAKKLQSLGQLATRMIHGPVLAVCLMLAILTLAVAGTEMMWHESYKSQLWTQVLLAGCCGVTWSVAAIGFRLSKTGFVKRFWFWGEVVAMFVSGLMIVKVIYLDPIYYSGEDCPAILCGLIWYCRVLVVLLGMLWGTETCIVAAAAVCWLMACLNPKTKKLALHVAFLLPALTVGFWGLALPIAWLTTAKFLRKFVELNEFEDLFHEAVPLMGVQVAMASFVGLVGMIVLARYAGWRNRHKNTPPEQVHSKPPRLIVAPSIQLMFAVSSIIGIGLVFFLGVMQWQGLPYEETTVGCVMAEANKYAVGFLLPTAFLIFLILPHLQPVFDIVLDVVNHFNFRSTRIADILDDQDEFDINESTFDAGRLFFARRDAIHVRFKTALAHYRDQIINRPDLTIISHSQGTMVAIEVLNDPELSWLKNKFATITLVTMGSPFTHLYQHYFPHFYPSLDDPQWELLCERVDRWVNVYRVDDYVGTHIEFPTEKMIATPKLPDGAFANFKVGMRGHMNYWRDAEVLKILRAELMGEDESTDAEDFEFRQAAA
jgi:hypothetical protein